jgi:hypothetical protein
MRAACAEWQESSDRHESELARWRGTAQALAASSTDLRAELGRIRPVHEAACAARDARSALEAARRAPRRSGSTIERHDRVIHAEDAWRDAIEACDAAVDAARPPR